MEPFGKPRLMVSRADDDRILVKNYGICESMEIRDFLYAGNREVILEVANDGEGSFLCEIEAEPCKWLKLEMSSREVKDQEILKLICCPGLLPEDEETCNVRISDGDAVVELKVYGKKVNIDDVPEMTFFENDGMITVLAEHFAGCTQGAVQVLRDYGLCQSAVRAVVVNADGKGSEEKTVISYYLMAEEDAVYTAVFDSIVNQYTLTLSAENGTVSGGGTFDYDTELTITATPDDGYEFTKWSDDNTDNPRTIILIENLELVAYFKKITNALDDVESSDSNVQKIYRDGHFFVIRKDQVFDFTGKKVE